MYDHKEYRKAHLAEYAGYQRASRARNPRQHMVYAARQRARRDGLPCDIAVGDIAWATHCPVRGVELIYTEMPKASSRGNIATLDRKVNSLGYTKGNVFVISHRANRLKQDATADELAAILAYIKG